MTQHQVKSFCKKARKQQKKSENEVEVRLPLESLCVQQVMICLDNHNNNNTKLSKSRQQFISENMKRTNRCNPPTTQTPIHS